MAQQYIGSRISLISKSDIRYRGVLHSIDPAASTVSLEQVRSMGTEGRKSNSADEIAPTDTLYEFIVFRAADVKDLSIEAPAEPKPEPQKPSVPDDPAIMSTTAPPRQVPGPNPFMPPHMMQPPQGMYSNSMPPMMYPPNNVPPQWSPYFPPPPGQMHPMMGFPPQQGGPLMGAQPSQPASSAVQSPPKPAIAPISGTSTKLPPPTSKISLGGSPVQPKAPPLPSTSPSKQLTPAVTLGEPSSTSSTTGSKPSQPVKPAKTPVSTGTHGGPPGKSVFGASTAMDMMATIAATKPVGSGNQPNKTSSQRHSTPPVTASKASQPSTSINSFLAQKDSYQQGNIAINNQRNTAANGTLSTPASQAQQHLRHPLPQVPPKTRLQPKALTGPHEHTRASQQVNFTPAPIVPSQDFDFASANAKFNKAAPLHKFIEAASNGQPEEVRPGEVDHLGAATEGLTLKTKDNDEVFIPEAPPGAYYDKKKSFFDDISSEVKERSTMTQEGGRGGIATAARGGGGRAVGRVHGGKGWDRNAERQKNLDTFGEVALNPNLGALGSGYNGYGRGGIHRIVQVGGVNAYRGRGRGYPRGIARGGGGLGTLGLRTGTAHNVVSSTNPLPHHR